MTIFAVPASKQYTTAAPAYQTEPKAVRNLEGVIPKVAALTAGAAAVNITPPVGVDLCGYGGRAGPSSGIHDELYAKALYLCGGEQGDAASSAREAHSQAGQALVITCDLIGLDYDSVAVVREGLARATGLGAEQVMIGCSHTHSGPVTPCLPTMGKLDENYFEILLQQLVSVGELAYGRAQEAWVGHNREPVAVGFNRREVSWPRVAEPVPEKGTILPHVDVLVVNGADGPLARLFVHPAHGVTLGGDNLLISADWMGYAQRFVEQLEAGCVALFGQGCCGNINSDPRGSFEIAETQGRAMAGAVIKATELAEMTKDVGIAVAREQLRLPCADPPSVAEAQEALQQAEADLEKARQQQQYGNMIFYEGMVKWARWLVEMSQKQATGLAIDYEVQGFRIGDFALVGLPGEVFVEYATNLEGRSPFQQTAVMAYTNGNPGYIPTAAAYARGGYEVEGAYRFYGGGYTMITADSERLILDAAEQVLGRLLGGGTQ